MERECNKCIHHTSGMCSSWDCKMQTVDDAKKEAVKEYVEAVVAELENTKENFEKDCSYWKEHSWKDNALYNEADLNEKQADCYADAISIVRGKE